LQRYAFAPQLYFNITEKVNLTFGINYLNEVRTGGAINAVRKEVDSTQTFYERNKSEQGASNM
jgi:hypothetical protein